MNNLFYNIINILNRAGRIFCDFSLSMFVQVSVLIVILLIVDILIRKRVRATFRYCIWMLVFVKLILPSGLSLPTGIGNFVGEYLVISSDDIETKIQNIGTEPEIAYKTYDYKNRARTEYTRPLTISPEVSVSPQITESEQTTESLVTSAQPSKANSITWQGAIFLTWFVGVLVLTVLLVQRLFFVRGLIAQSEPAKNRLLDTLEECRNQLGIKKNIQMRLSHNASSPAVCGLFKPVILIPTSILDKISHDKLKAILIHELSHIKRVDLLVNCIQTCLQIIYFYNPLLWLANSIVRKIREQAVDEMVLVALGEEAKSYTNILIDVAEMAFSRPALSLRLVGVVESKKALSERIKHILSRPFPKSAKLGFIGILVIILASGILLPMAKNDTFANLFNSNVLIKFDSEDPLNGKRTTRGNTETYSKNYTVKIKKGEKIGIVAELYQVGKPMQAIGYKVFSGTTQPQRLSVVLSRKFLDDEKTSISHNLKVTLGDQILEAKNIKVETSEFLNNTDFGVFQGSQIAIQKDDDKSYIDYEKLLFLRVFPNFKLPLAPRIWMPGHNNISWADSDAYFVLVKIVPMSQIDNLKIEAPWDDNTQLPDGTYYSSSESKVKRRAVVDDYLRNLKEELFKSKMPLPKLSAHQFYKYGEPIKIKTHSSNSGQWKPTLEDLDAGREICFYSIDGKVYDSRLGFGPFGAFGMNLNIPSDLYIKDFKLPVGKHKVSYGWRDIYAVNLDDSEDGQFYEKLLTDPVEFEVVEEIPENYYSEAYEEGWDKTLAENIEVRFTDDPEKLQIVGPLLILAVKPLPFEVAFDIYAQAEGSEEREYLTRFARTANPPGGTFLISCDQYIDDLDWDNAGQKRYRLILVPSEKAAIENPPVTHYYGKEYITDWAAFEKSKNFDEHYKRYGNSKKEKEPSTKSQFERTLPSGATLELVGICEYPSEGKQWWAPDGSILSKAPYHTTGNRITDEKEGYKYYEFALKIDPVNSSYRWNIPGGSHGSDTGSPRDANDRSIGDLKAYATNLPQDQEKVDVRIGATSAEWETVVKYKPEDKEKMYSVGDYTIAFGIAHNEDNRTLLPIVHNYNQKERLYAIQVIAITKSGGIRVSGYSGLEGRELSSMTYIFNNLPLDDVEEFQFQIRPYEWVTFENVSLHHPDVQNDEYIKPENKDSVALNTPEKESETKISWGEIKNGLRCGLVQPGYKWNLEDPLYLALILSNEGQAPFDFAPLSPEMECEIEVDGQWYGWADLMPEQFEKYSFDAKGSVKINLSDSWALPKEGENLKYRPGDSEFWGKSLKINPGKHTFRVKFRPLDWLDSYKNGRDDLFVISDPIEIEYLESTSVKYEPKLRFFVNIVAGSDEYRVGYKGQQITWEQLKEKLINLPDKKSTVLEIGFEPGVIPPFQNQEDKMLWLLNNNAYKKVGKYVKELGFEYISFVGEDNPSSRRGPVSIRIVKPMDYNNEIDVGLQSFEEEPLLEINDIKFNNTQNGLTAKLTLDVTSSPHTLWEISVFLLDERGAMIGSVVQSFDNTGIIKTLPVHSKDEMEFNFGNIVLSFVEKFEVKLREVGIKEVSDEAEKQDGERIILNADVVTLKQPYSKIKEYLDKETSIIETSLYELTEEQIQKFKEWAVSFPGTNIVSNQKIYTNDGQFSRFNITSQDGIFPKRPDPNAPSDRGQVFERITSGIIIELTPHLNKSENTIVMEMAAEISNVLLPEDEYTLPSVRRRNAKISCRIPTDKYVLISDLGILPDDDYFKIPQELKSRNPEFDKERVILILKAEPQ